MSNKYLKLYYIYFIPITLLQSVSTLLLLLVLSVEDYGTLTLYLTNINLFFVLTFGIQLGYTIVFRSNKDEPTYTSKFNLLSNFFTIFMLIIVLVLHFIFNFDILLTLSLISSCLMISFSSQKAIFQTNYQIHSLNLAILAFRIIPLIDLVLYLVTDNLQAMLYFDVFLRIIHSAICNIVIHIQYKRTTFKDFINWSPTAKNIIYSGFPIMIGNWITMLYLLADKYVLRDDLTNLGYYSFAITIVVLFRVLISPLKELFFVSMAVGDVSTSIDTNVKRSLIIGSILTIFAFLSMMIAFNFLHLFEKYRIAQESVYILLGIIPISISLEVFLFNNSRINNGRLYLLKSVLCGVLMFGSLYIYKQYADIFSLSAFSALVLINYIFIYLFFAYESLQKKSFFKSSLLLIGFELIYMFIIF